MVSLGLHVPAWERADFPHIPAVGNFEAAVFEPAKWKSNYPNARGRIPDAQLAERRDKIGRWRGSTIWPRNYRIQWARFDNQTGHEVPVAADDSPRIPEAMDGTYWKAEIRTPGEDQKRVQVYIRRRGGVSSVVGVERTW